MKIKTEFALTKGERIGDIIKSKYDTQQSAAKKIGCSASLINDLVNDRPRNISGENIKGLCRYLGVSADWLLGLSDVESPETDLQAVCEYTGLSEGAVDYITLLSATGRQWLLSELLTNRKFDNLLAYCEAYIKAASKIYLPSYSQTPDYIRMADELKKYGYSITVPADSAEVLYKSRITNTLENLLDGIVDSTLEKVLSDTE